MEDKELYEGAFSLPSQKEWKVILDSFPPIKDIFLNCKFLKANEKYHPLDFQLFIASNDLDIWLNRLNNKLGKLRFSYVLSQYYFLKGIPDENWEIELEAGGTKFFPDFKNKGDHYIHFLFNYSTENFYYHYISALDCLAQLLNIYYGINIVEKKVSFNIKFIEKLVVFDTNLSDQLNYFLESTEVIRDSRNGFAHRFPSNEIDFRSKKSIENGREVITMGSSHYKNSKQSIKEMQNSIKLLAKLLRDVEISLKKE